MPTTFASTRTTPSGVSFAATSGGSLTGSGSIWLSYCYRTRGGFSLGANMVQVSYSAGQKIVATIASSALQSGELGNVHQIIIIGNSTNSLATASILAAWEALQPDQLTQNALPATVELSRDAHLILSGTVAAIGNLPTGSDRVNGMIRYVTAASAYYRYSATDSVWQQYTVPSNTPNGFSAYVSSTTVPSGIDRDLKSVQSADTIAPPSYYPDGSLSTPVRIVIQNGYTEGGGTAIAKGNPIGVELTLDGQNAINLFSGKIQAKYLGLFRKSTGTLDTTNADSGYSAVQFFQSTGQSLATSSLYARDDVPSGYGLLYAIAFQFRAGDVPQLVQGSQINLYLYAATTSGTYNPAGAAAGDTIVAATFSPDGRARILPYGAATIQSAPGAGFIKCYDFARPSVRTAIVTQPDTPGQKVAIAGNTGGGITVRQPADSLLSTEGQRAKVSTLNGTYAGSPWSSPIAVGASGAIQVTVTYPAAIRSDYPDVIAGTTAYFNVPRLRVFVEFPASSGNYYETTAIAVTPNVTSQQFTITSLPGSSSLPSASSDPAFCLFDYPSAPSGSDVGGGSLSAGNYRVRIYYHFPSPNLEVTAIDHTTASGNIPELGSTLADAIAAANDASASSAGIVFNDSSPPSTNGTQSAIYSASGKLSLVGYSNALRGPIATLATPQSYTKSQSVAPVALTDGPTIAVDASLSNVFRVTLAGNRTLANPTNLSDGQTLVFMIKQDATGGRTLSYGTAYDWPGGAAPTLSTAANAIDVVTCVYDGSSSTLLCAINKNFA
ncbi:MAG: hypothetical protein ACP5RH_01580 [Leptodesmis sp.]|uniref:hypothetical protein n=1 Tax=Leptodesmis sp. TaxID=3100501 RepID=UPI003D109551